MSADDARKNIYADIIDLPHHVSERHTPMPMINSHSTALGEIASPLMLTPFKKCLPFIVYDFLLY